MNEETGLGGDALIEKMIKAVVEPKKGQAGKEEKPEELPLNDRPPKGVTQEVWLKMKQDMALLEGLDAMAEAKKTGADPIIKGAEALIKSAERTGLQGDQTVQAVDHLVPAIKPATATPVRATPLKSAK